MNILKIMRSPSSRAGEKTGLAFIPDEFNSAMKVVEVDHRRSKRELADCL